MRSLLMSTAIRLRNSLCSPMLTFNLSRISTFSAAGTAGFEKNARNSGLPSNVARKSLSCRSIAAASSLAAIAAFGHHAPHEVALGKNPDELAVVQDRNCADDSLDHDTHGFEHSVTQFRLIRVLILDQVADKHFDASRLQSSELSKSIYRGASICRKGDGKKVKKVGRERNFPLRVYNSRSISEVLRGRTGARGF